MTKRYLLPIVFLVGLGYLAQERGLYADVPAATLERTEQVVNRIIRAWQAGQPALSFTDQSWMEITLAEVIQKAIQANLALRQGSLTVKNTQEAQKRSEAAFDPVLSASGSFSRSETLDRTVQDMKYKKATTPCPQAGDKIVLDKYGSLVQVIHQTDAGYATSNGITLGGGGPNDLWICQGLTPDEASQPAFVVYPPTSPVHFLRLNDSTGNAVVGTAASPGPTARPEGYYLTNEDASKANPGGATQTGTFSLGLYKALPWGVETALNEQTVHQDALWVLHAGAPSPIIGSYDRPWTSSSVASLAVPVPYGKNFGRYSALDATVESSALDQQRSRADFQTQANTLLQTVQSAYWDLVSGSRTLDAIIQNEHVVEVSVARTRRLFDSQRTTAYAMAQMEAEQERVRNQEIVAWNNYVMVSNNLKLLLNMKDSQSVLLIPVGYSVELSHFAGMDIQEAIRVGLLANARLQSQTISKDQADLNRNQAESQARPDLSLNASLSGTQSSVPFGYGSLSESLTNLANPDTISVSVGATYRYPWKNQWANAHVKQAEAQQSVSDLQQQLAHNQVERSIKNAHAALDSALLRIAITARHLQLARASYEGAERLRTAGRVVEYELIVKSGDLLTAEKDFLLAQVEAKKAETDQLAAMGSLGQNEQVAKEYGP